MFKDKISTLKPQTKNYSILFSTVSKTWLSGPECWPRKYGWFSSGHTKQSINPELNHLSTPELNHHSLQGRRSRPLGQPLISELNHPSIHGRRSRALARVLPTLNGGWNSSSQTTAFTIIEVILVLAIAGLIFLMVFIALPALQRSQRDTQRKQDLSRALTAMQQYYTNNRRLPTTDRSGLNDDLARNYLKSTSRDLGSEIASSDEWHDPSGMRYWFNYYSLHLTQPLTLAHDGQNYFIYVFYGSRCDGDRVRRSESSNSFTLSIVLEGGGVYCLDN